MYDRIADEINKFEQLITKINYEFIDSTLPTAISVKKENWIQCTACKNIFNYIEVNAITCCPEC